MEIDWKVTYGRTRFGLTTWKIGERLGGFLWPVDSGYALTRFAAETKVANAKAQWELETV